MKQVLQKLCQDGQWLSIYSNINDFSAFRFGRILAVSNKQAVILAISPDGGYDGIFLKEIAEIYRIETGCQYTKKMLHLMPEKLVDEWCPSIEGDDLVISVLHAAMNEAKIVSVGLLDSGCYDLIGFVKNIEDGVATILQVDDYGVEDGISYVRIADITEMTCDSLDERRIQILWHCKSK